MRFLLTALLLIALPSQAAQVEIKTADGQSLVMLSDVIVPGDAARLEQALAQIGNNPLVYLDSRGGDVDEGMALGRMLRRHGAIVSYGYCASSCVFAFLGGVKRLANSRSGAYINVHRPQLAEAYVASPSPFAKRMLDMLRDYTVEMIGSDDFYNEMMRIPFSAPQFLPIATLRSMNVLTQ